MADLIPLQYRCFSSEEDAITAYFHQGYQYRAVILFLSRYHGIMLSIRTLKRRLREYGLRRVLSDTPGTRQRTVEAELMGAGSLSGYRLMWQRLRQGYNIHVSQHTVRNILRHLDPGGVELRRHRRLRRRTYYSNGPNEIWHIDGYDKLKPYGFAISGAIDGFSRRIIWLACSFTNNDPSVINGYYIDAVRQCHGCPKKVRSDCGTENVTVAACQCLLSHTDNAHIYGTSPHNQRIESWWSFYRRHRSQWWIILFQDINAFLLESTRGLTQTEILRFCFMDLLNKDLKEVMNRWNSHRIRRSTSAVCLAGVPDELYFTPPDDYEDCKIDICQDDVLFCEQFTKPSQRCADALYEEYLESICNSQDWLSPLTVNDAIQLYINIVSLLQGV